MTESRAIARLVRASLFTAVAMQASAPAAAQIYHNELSATAIAGHPSTYDSSWDGVVFPSRRNRRHARAPSRNGLDQRRQACDRYFHEAAAIYKLPLTLLQAVAHVESGFSPTAVSVDGAMGIMQLMPFTARKMGVTQAYDARQNILGGARFLRILANQWAGDIILTLAAYNAGSGAVKKYGGVPPYKETQRYVRRVMTRYRAYSAAPR